MFSVWTTVTEIDVVCICTSVHSLVVCADEYLVHRHCRTLLCFKKFTQRKKVICLWHPVASGEPMILGMTFPTKPNDYSIPFSPEVTLWENMMSCESLMQATRGTGTITLNHFTPPMRGKELVWVESTSLFPSTQTYILSRWLFFICNVSPL